MAEILGAGGLVILLFPISFGLALWALIDAAIRPEAAFKTAGQSKVLWIILPIVGIFLFAIVGGILGVVYLVGIRPKVRLAQ
ncbi:MAG: DUF2516 family protein [Acidimicrobiales bacterium]|nr:DUF2516 family protein [Acidimicrobiales bacterium]